MGDFSGDPTQPLRPLSERKFVQIDRDNFNEIMARMTPGLNLRVDNKLADDGSQMAVSLKFNAIEDFEPARVAEQIPALKALLETRAKLRDLMTKVDRSEQLESLLEQILRNENELKSLSGSSASRKRRAEPCPRRGSLPKPAPRRRKRLACLEQVVAATRQTEPDRAQELVKTLVEQALAGTVTFDETCRAHSTARSLRSMRSFPPSSMPSSITRASYNSKAPGGV